jgi:hypothetical protein
VTDKITLGSTAVGSKRDHYLDLARLVGSVSQNQAQQRALVYEFARIKLRRELYRQFEEGDWTGIQQQVLALEVAISQVEEEFSAGQLPPPVDQMAALPDNVPATTGALRPISQHEVVFGEASPPSFLYSREPRSVSVNIFDQTAQSSSKFWWTVQLAGAVFVGLALFVAFGGRNALQSFGLPSGQTNSSNAAPAMVEAKKVASPGFPVPGAYGIYALNNGKLTELDPLPIRVPDPRIAISAQISTPSRVHLADGKLQFIVFRRDLVADAPDHVSVRVVAQLVRALSFDPGGKASTNPVDNAWLVRSNAYQLRVAPVPDNTEMIDIRSSDPSFTFPPGRYALVLKNIGYDFTVDGAVTDPAHCLERTDAVNTPIYSECRTPERGNQ